MPQATTVLPSAAATPTNAKRPVPDTTRLSEATASKEPCQQGEREASYATRRSAKTSSTTFYTAVSTPAIAALSALVGYGFPAQAPTLASASKTRTRLKRAELSRQPTRF